MAMSLPPCEQFDMGRCPNCPLKNAVARFIVNNQVAQQNGSRQLDPVKDRFLPAHDARLGLTTGDNEKFNVIARDEENPYYTVDDRDCAGPVEVSDFGFGMTLEKLACDALMVPKI